LTFKFTARGHPEILSTHHTTLEITRDEKLTKRGNCIIAVASTKALQEIPTELKQALTQPGAKGLLIMRAGSFTFRVRGSGDPRLSFSHLTDIVVRKSGFISDRTLLVNADKSASDIPREMVRILRDPSCMITIEISAIAR
jgi:uncharacterized protein